MKQSVTWTQRQRQAALLLKGPATHTMLYGGRRSGKTFLILTKLLIRAGRYPGSRHLCVRYRAAHAWASLWHETLYPMVSNAIDRGRLVLNQKDGVLYFVENGSEIWIGGLDDKERTEKLLGREYASVFMNEVSQISYEARNVAISGLAQNIPGLQNRAYYDCNPPSPFHWVHRIFVEKVEPESMEPLTRPDLYASMLMNPVDNAENLPEGYIEDTLSNLPPKLRDRLRDGKFVSQEGIVYDDIVPDVHIIDPFQIPESWRHFRVIDFGFKNPFVCLWLALSPDDRLYVYDEHYQKETLLKDHATAILSRDPIDRYNPGRRIQDYELTIADTDAQDIAELLDHGISDLDAAVKIGVSEGIQAVKTRLIITEGEHEQAESRLYIFRTCYNTIAETTEYKWPERKHGVNDKEEPIKKDDHSMDCIRMCVVTIDDGSSIMTLLDVLKNQPKKLSRREMLRHGVKR